MSMFKTIITNHFLKEGQSKKVGIVYQYSLILILPDIFHYLREGEATTGRNWDEDEKKTTSQIELRGGGNKKQGGEREPLGGHPLGPKIIIA